MRLSAIRPPSSEATIDTQPPTIATRSAAPAPAGNAFSRLPQGRQFAVVAAVSALLITLFSALLADRSAPARYLDKYGALIADQVARLSHDAIAREDVIALNVLAEQIATDPAIASVTIYSMDGHTLAAYGAASGTDAPAGRDFSRPIQLADATAGFVTVTVEPGALTPEPTGLPDSPVWRHVAAGLLTALTLWAALYWLLRTPSTAVARDATDAPARDVILLLVHLFNGASMTPTRRQALLDASGQHIRQASELYGALQVQIDDDAIAVVFEDPQNDERTFQAACAGLVIASLCDQPGGGRYRYSLQTVRLPAQTPRPLDDAALGNAAAEALDDALLHAALADDNTIAVSSEYALALPRPERLDMTREHSPALAALQSAAAEDYYLLSGANATTQTMLSRQLDALLGD